MNNVFVLGDPVTQGSMSVFRGRIVHRNSAKLMAWRQAIASAYRGEKMTGPVHMQMDFIISKPKRTSRFYPRLDLDKLIRAVLDALTGHAYDDDSQVISVIATKTFGNTPGVLILIKEDQ